MKNKTQKSVSQSLSKMKCLRFLGDIIIQELDFRNDLWDIKITTVEPRNSELQFSGKTRNSGQFSNDQLFIK